MYAEIKKYLMDHGVKEPQARNQANWMTLYGQEPSLDKVKESLRICLESQRDRP